MAYISDYLTNDGRTIAKAMGERLASACNDPDRFCQLANMLERFKPEQRDAAILEYCAIRYGND